MTNIAAPFIAQFFTEQFNAVLENTDLVVCNDNEAEEWSKKNGGPETDSDESHEQIAKMLGSYKKS